MFSVENLRSDLHKATEQQGIFLMGEKADASEAFMYLLENIHKEIGDGAKPCRCPVHTACHTSLKRMVRCEVCKTQVTSDLNENYFFHTVGVSEILDFADKEDIKRMKSQGVSAEQRSPESLITLISGQFFNIFRLTNYKIKQQMSCPKEKSQCPMAPTKVKVQISEPFPAILNFTLSWRDEDILHTNCLKVLASLPPHVYPSNIFDCPKVKVTYRLCGIFAFTGSHYLSFLRVAVSGSSTRLWTLFNDT